MTRPSVKLVKSWEIVYDSDLVQLSTGDALFYSDYWKLLNKSSGKIKYFYGEAAYQNSRREAGDLDFSAWCA
jgi:hypothetical protein